MILDAAPQSDLLSVIVRTMPGREQFLAECLLGLAGQTYRPIEVIVVAQQRHADNDLEPVRAIISQTQFNLGPVIFLHHSSPDDARSRSLNLGIASAHGRYLALCDDDDYVHPSHYTELILAMGKNDTAWAYSDTERVLYGPKQQIVQRNLPYRRTHYSFARLIGSNFIPPCSFLVDRAKIPDLPPFDETRHILEDYDFLLRLGYRYSPSYVRSATCEYRLRLDGTNTAPVGNPAKRLQWLRAEISLSRLKRALLRDWVRDASRGERSFTGLFSGAGWYAFRLIKCYVMLGILRIIFSEQPTSPGRQHGSR